MIRSVSVFGLGKVGTSLVSSLAAGALRVIGVDLDRRLVDALNTGAPVTNEPGVRERLAKAGKGDVRATLDPADAVANSELSFIIVPTPSNSLNGFSNRNVAKVCEEIGRAMRGKASGHTVSVVST